MSDNTKLRVLITCSARGGVPYWWFSAYDRTLQLNHPEYHFDFQLESGNNAINISRNIAADTAIKQDYWKLVQIDADNFWTPELLVRLVSHREDIVAMPYCKKQSGPVKFLMVKTPGAAPRADGLLACDFMGTGMMATSVAALKEMVACFPEREFVYDDDDGKGEAVMTELFPIGVVGPNSAAGRLARIKKVIADNKERGNGNAEGALHVVESILAAKHPAKSRFLGEDYGFCALARKTGLTLWCDTGVIVGHVGDVVYPIGPDKLSTANDIPTHTHNLDEW